MGVETKSEYPFSVDTWTEISKRKPFHFLTHAHKDHTGGIESHGTFPIYCTPLTQKLVCRRYPKLNPTIFKFLEVGEAKCISNEDEGFSVTAYDANHCPGAVMLLFEGPFGKVLHTGDCRLTIHCLNQLPGHCVRSGGRVVDCLYLDCTFGNQTIVMPSKEEAIEQVKSCIWNHPNNARIFLACDMLGQEQLLEAVADSFGVKIYVDKNRLSNYYEDLEVVAPNFLTTDLKATRFEICEGYPKLYERATQAIEQAKKEGSVEPLFIRPSAQWYTYEERLQGDGSGVISAPSASFRFGGAKRRSMTSSFTKATRDEFGVWHVCYSMHSSRSELERALEVLNPAQVISTTPHCGPCDLTKSALPDFVVNEAAKAATNEATKAASNEATKPASNEATIAAIEHCVLEDREFKRGKRDYSCSPAKVSDPVSLADSPVPLFGSAQFGLPPSPPVSFSSPCPAVPITTPPPRSQVASASSLPTQNARAKRLFIEPESEFEISSVSTGTLPQIPSKRRYGSDSVPPVDESSSDLKTSSFARSVSMPYPPSLSKGDRLPPVDEPSADLKTSYARSVSMPYPPSLSKGDSLPVRSKSLSRVPSRRKFRIPDPLPSLLDMTRNRF